jgi:hypothetical protein
MKTINELNENELNELNGFNGYTYKELMNKYKGVNFVNEDFFCNINNN